MRFIFNNLEYFVGAAGVVGTVIWFSTRKHNRANDDLSSLIVQQKKHSDSINKRSKGGIF